MTRRAIISLAFGLSEGVGSVRPIELVLVLLSLTLGATAFGAAGAAVSAAVLVPVTIGMAMFRLAQARGTAGHARSAANPLRTAVGAAAGTALAGAAATGRGTACLILALDDPGDLVERHGRGAQETVMSRIAERVEGALREDDQVLRLEDTRLAVILRPVRRADLESVLQVASRLLAAASEPVSLDSTSIYVTVSCGFCLSSRSPERTGTAFLTAAEQATEEALRNGPGAIRAWTAEIARAAADRSSLRDAVAEALEQDRIVAHFQPQLSTDTGEVTGFEVLVRWNHPTRGTLVPADFLPAVHAAGLSERLAEVMIYQALSALRGWERKGWRIPHVAVNLSRDELRNPRLADRIKWELDRFEIQPDRLTIEVLETVVTESGDDVIVHNVAALAGLGCRIDLDDFGTGQASIAQLRRFAVNRIKIDRSFVTHVDTDQSQRRMVAAILSLAEQLGLETVAEGVESLGEHAILAQLGCTFVQGFGIARPMPYDETLAWLQRHAAKLAEAPRIGRRAG